MTLQNVLETAEKDRNIGRIDVNIAISSVNDALRQISEIGGFLQEELIDYTDEKSIISSFEIIRLDSVLIGQDEKFVPLKEIKDGRYINYEE